jgi:hypothetical protein
MKELPQNPQNSDDLKNMPFLAGNYSIEKLFKNKVINWHLNHQTVLLQI